MLDMCTVVSRYRATLTAYVDTQYIPIATDKYGRIIFSHAEDAVTGSPLYSSVRIGDGVDLLDVINGGDTVSGSTGIVVFGEGGNGQAYPIPIDESTDTVKVSGSLDMDPTPGNDGNKHSDQTGANTEPGVVDSVTTASWVDVVSISIATGTYVLQDVHIVADRTCQFRLIIDDNGTPSAYIGNWMVTQNVASYQFDWLRAKEITGQTNRSLKLQAIRRAVGLPNANASGMISGFTR